MSIHKTKPELDTLMVLLSEKVNDFIPVVGNEISESLGIKAGRFEVRTRACSFGEDDELLFVITIKTSNVTCVE